jgi:uncharacterized protein (DUF2062 family)
MKRMNALFRVFLARIKTAFVNAFLPWRAVGITGKGFRHNLLFFFTSAASPNKAAQSLAVGVFMGIMPVYGFQLVLLTFLAAALRLNWPLAFLGVNVSFAPLMPLIIAAAIAAGKTVVSLLHMSPTTGFWASTLGKGSLEWLVGSVVLAVIAGALTYAISLVILRRIVRPPLGSRK